MAKRTTRIDDSDHVCRYVRPTLLDIDPDTNEMRGIFNAAFHLRPSDEGELSVNHLQHYPGGTIEQLRAVMLGKKASGFGVRHTSAFAVLQATEIAAAGKRVGLSLASYKDPILPHEPSHAVVWGLPEDASSEVFEDLARIASRRFFLTKEL